MTETNTDTAALIESATQTLKRLDSYALGEIATYANIALRVQENTKADLAKQTAEGKDK